MGRAGGALRKKRFSTSKNFFSCPPPPPPPCPLPKKVGAKGRKFKFLTLRICKREKEKKKQHAMAWPQKIRIKIRETKEKFKSFPYQSETQWRFSFERSGCCKRLTTQENRDKQTFIGLGWTFFGSESLVIKSLRRCGRRRKVSGRKKEKKMGKLLLLSPIENSISPCQIDRRFGDIGRDIFPLFKKWDTPRFDTSKSWNFLHFRI